MTARRMVLLAGVLIWAALAVPWYTNAAYLAGRPLFGFVVAILPVIVLFEIVWLLISKVIRPWLKRRRQ